MAILIFKLRFVPDDEAQEIRELLIDNEINFYETSAGVIGTSMPGLWLKDEAQLPMAKKLIDEYQQSRLNRAREEYELSQDQGTARTIMDMFKESPGRYISFVVAIFLVCYFTIFAFYNI